MTIQAKFQTLVNGATHFMGTDAVAGTNHEIRTAIWEEFRSIYNESVTIRLHGEVITLKANHSLSGKSTSYFSEISNEQYVTIFGSDFGLTKNNMPRISIEGGVVYLKAGGKFFTKIENKNVEII